MAEFSQPELRKLIAGGESTSLELKLNPPRPGELAGRICGLANARGGYIIFGVEDGSLRLTGIKNPAEAADVVLRAARLVDPPLELEPDEPALYRLDGVVLLVLEVPKSRGPLYQAGGAFWIRRGTNTVPMNIEQVKKALNDRGDREWEQRPVEGASWEDLDQNRIQLYLKKRQDSYRILNRFSGIQEMLEGMRCVVRQGEEFIPTNCGLLFFGKDPQLHLPQSEIVCVLYRDSYGIGGYVDRKVVIGSCQEIIDQTAAFINLYLPVEGKIAGWERIDRPELPLEVLREALVNAVIHRDYSRTGERIRVFIYSDRVEIHSPGRLLPGINVEMMERGEVGSVLRNPRLAGLLRDTPGYAETIGSGIRLMLAETRRQGLPPPQFRELDEFVVSFKRPGAETTWPPETGEPASERPETGNEGPVPDIHGRNNRLVLALLYIQQNGYITNMEYRRLTGVSERVASRDLAGLVQDGSLSMDGKTRSRRYRLP